MAMDERISENSYLYTRGSCRLEAAHLSKTNIYHIPYILAYKSLSRISRPLKIESVCGQKSVTRV